MSIIDEISNQKYWDDTLERMLRKTNLTTEQEMELVLLNTMGFKNKFIEQVLSETYNWSIPRKIQISKIGTKRKRTVYMYSIQDRYVLGVLYRVFSFYYIDAISSNCYSYKRGVRTLNAIDYIRSDKDISRKSGVKLDIHAYFNSVNRRYLIELLEEISNKEVYIEKLLKDLYLDDRVIFEGQEILEYKSLIPGAAFSSFLANYCLKDIDRYVSEDLGLTYARYSDDILYFADTKEQLNIALNMITEKLNDLDLEINETKYEWFEPGEDIDFLGLKIKDNKKVDISDNSLRKFKKKIKHSCKVGRNEIERLGKDPCKVAKNIIGRYNYRVYKCYIQDSSKFGWAYYAFRYINTIDTLRELDFYLRDRLRQMITGVNNSSNIKKVPDEKLKELGYVSMVEMFFRFKEDFDYYCDTVDLIQG